nr:uncharacterized protein LOC129445093 [Misgurnus anguillicaudatus]
MKMSSGCCCVLLLLALVAAVSGVDVKKKVGSEARFKPDIPAGSSLKDSIITWKYTAGGEVIIVIEWDNDFQTLEIRNPKFKTRVDLNRNNGELTIRDLKLEHTGSYSIEINNIEKKRISLIVKESVPKPKLNQEISSNPDDVMYLTCEYNAMIRWACSNGKKPQITNLEKPRQGEIITFRRTEMPNICCTCTLINDVSEETSDPLCEKDLFPEMTVLRK